MSIFESRVICEKTEILHCLWVDNVGLVTDIPGDLVSAAIYPFSTERRVQTAFDFESTIALMPFDRPLTRGTWRVSDWGKK